MPAFSPQGESDAGIQNLEPAYRFYGELLSALLRSWRHSLAAPKLPFVIVQLAAYTSPYARLDEKKHYGADHWPVVREAQRQVSL